MSIAALFTIDRTWKQPKYPSKDEQRRKMGQRVWGFGKERARLSSYPDWSVLGKGRNI